MVVPKNNGKLRICIDFRKLNATTNKDLYLLPFIDEIINTIARHEIYTFVDKFSRYQLHQRTSTKLHVLETGGLLCGL